MGLDAPDGTQGEEVDVSDLLEGQERLSVDLSGAEALVIDPLRGIGVAPDLEVVAELLVADSATFEEESLDFLTDEGVPFEGRRIVGLVEPDVLPDRLRLARSGKAAQSLAELPYFDRQSFVDVRPAGTTPGRQPPGAID
jgi:hypothetical protein